MEPVPTREDSKDVNHFTERTGVLTLLMYLMGCHVPILVTLENSIRTNGFIILGGKIQLHRGRTFLISRGIEKSSEPPHSIESSLS